MFVFFSFPKILPKVFLPKSFRISRMTFQIPSEQRLQKDKKKTIEFQFLATSNKLSKAQNIALEKQTKDRKWKKRRTAKLSRDSLETNLNKTLTHSLALK